MPLFLLIFHIFYNIQLRHSFNHIYTIHLSVLSHYCIAFDQRLFCFQVSDSLAAPPPVSLAEVAEAVRLSVLQENFLHRMEQLVLTSGLPISGSLHQLAEQHNLIQG
jgi:hypothetical protein